MHLLWADDDCNGLLVPLGRLLTRKGHFIVAKAEGYSTAMQKLDEARGAENTKIQTLLLDIILPFADGSGALASDLGLTLAERSVNYGVKTIAFLTVVRLDEVIDKYNALVSNNLDVRFAYFDKTTMLEPNELEALIEYLSNGNSIKP